MINYKKQHHSPGHKFFIENFRNGLLAWNKSENVREMPWKGEKNPYWIWVSEIVLQQTRVEQGLKYYERFIAAFPTVGDLADAPQQQVFKLWEGLGYYSRCKNLIASAKYIKENLAGQFPGDYETILSLKGVGTYTAAAISSFAFNLPYAVLDGNVFRVLSRIFDRENPIDSTEGKKMFAALAEEILPKENSAIYNQAIMDFGATICKPVPQCPACFFKRDCKAFLKGKQQALPVKAKQVSVKKRWFNYIVVSSKKKYALRQRTQKDIWQNLYEFPLLETEKSVSEKEFLVLARQTFNIDEAKIKGQAKAFEISQRLTHQLIHFRFIHFEIDHPDLLSGFTWVSRRKLMTYAFPKTLHNYVRQNLQ